jgi:coenzyme F420-reducing hydrogenase gamma subunit
MPGIKKPTIAVYKFSSCDGCQLNILNLEDELLDLVGVVEIAYFLEATRAMLPSPYDIGIVEGSITTEEEIERIKDIRRNVGTLIALGTCATAGGIQALRNFEDVEKYTDVVYQHPEFIETLDQSHTIADHVRVDLELWGCPISKSQILEVLTAVLQDRRPNLPKSSLCQECKLQGLPCVMVAYDIPCLGPITKAGCGAICPDNGRGCYGCFGPFLNAELEAFIPLLVSKQRFPGEALRLIRTISGNAPMFIEAAEMILVQEVN